MPVLLIAYMLVSKYFNISDYLTLKNVNTKRCNEREYIYMIMCRLSSPYFKGKFLSYLEFNVDYAIGEWPDKDIFNAYNDKAITRLAKLEEKWLKYNKL